MNQLQVLKKLIPIYTEAINRIADGEDVRFVIESTHTKFGICYYMYKVYNEIIGEEKWVKEISESIFKYWYLCPLFAYNVEVVLECLSYRLTIMQLMVMDITQK